MCVLVFWMSAATPHILLLINYVSTLFWSSATLVCLAVLAFEVVKLVMLVSSYLTALESFSGHHPCLIPLHGYYLFFPPPKIQRASCLINYLPLVQITLLSSGI